MLSHLWWAKKHDKTPPKRWEKLQVLVTKVTCGHDSGSSFSDSPDSKSSSRKLQDEQADCALQAEEAKVAHGVLQAEEVEAVSSGSEDVQVICI